MQELGPEYRLDDILDLERIGLKDWPYSMAGKLSVVELKERVTAWISSGNIVAESQIS